MSYHEAAEPVCTAAAGAIELLIEPRSKNVDGMTVRRLLPSRDRRMVGPFVFFDHMGPAEFPPGEGIQVRPHPHIGLATVTYLFEGEIMHRDGLGYVQPIRPGAVNLMTAGRGIVHSERAGDDLHTTSLLHGIQLWLALPLDDEECEPAFDHYPAAVLPRLERGGVHVTVIIGEAFGMRSPVATRSATIYLDCRMPAGSTLTVPAEYQEQAAYVVDGSVRIGERSLEAGLMAVACEGDPVSLEAAADSHVLLIGGENLGTRHIWWNYVSSSEQRIEQAKRDWLAKRYPMVPGDEEFIPLPE